MSTTLEAEPGKGDRALPLETPRDDGGKLVWPSIASCGEIIAAHRSRLESCGYDVHGQTLAELAAAARHELLAEALAYSRQYRDVSIADDRRSIDAMPSLVLAGHQPE